MEHSAFVLDKLLQQLVDVIGYRAEEKGLEFLIRRSPDVPYSLVGDRLRVGQILTNLCSNAVKFTNQGVIELSIEVLDRDETGVKLIFSVRDTGIGLDSEQSLVFQMTVR